jgi:hypothetical protein
MANRAVRDSGELASRGPAYNQNAWPRRNPGLEIHADESYDDAALIFDCCTGDFVPVVAVTHHPVDKSCVEAIKLGCHENLRPPRAGEPEIAISPPTDLKV